MATLGTLTLKLRANRLQLIADLQQAENLVQSAKKSLNSQLNLKIGASVDWESFSDAESEVRRWVDSLPKTNLNVTAKVVTTNVTDSLRDLERLLTQPLKILVDDSRLFELNEHFKLKERDYRQLQTVLSSPLEIKVDRSQLDNLIQNPLSVGLAINLDDKNLEKALEKIAASMDKIGKKNNQSNSVANGLFFSFGQSLGAEVQNSFGRTLQKNFNIDPKQTIVGSILDPMMDKAAVKVKAKLDDEGFKTAVENTNQIIAKRLRTTGYILGEAIVAGLEQHQGTINEKLMAFGQNITPHLNKIPQAVKDDAQAVAKNFSGQTSVTQDIANSIGSNIARYREAALREKAAPMVVSRANEILDSGRKKNTANSVNDDTEQLFIVTGGYARKRGLSGARLVENIQNQIPEHQKANSVVLWSKNKESDLPDREGEISKQTEVRDIATSIAKPILKGYSNDAVEMAAQAMAAIERNPNIKVKLIGESGGGLVAQEAAKLLEILGHKDKTEYIGVGTPKLPHNLKAQGTEILSPDEYLGKAIEKLYNIIGIKPQQATTKGLHGVAGHVYSYYEHTHPAQLQDTIEGPAQPLGRKAVARAKREIRETKNSLAQFDELIAQNNQNISSGNISPEMAVYSQFLIDSKSALEEELNAKIVRTKQRIVRQRSVESPKVQAKLDPLLSEIDNVYYSRVAIPTEVTQVKATIANNQVSLAKAIATPGVKAAQQSIDSVKELLAAKAILAKHIDGTSGSEQTIYQNLLSQAEALITQFQDPSLSIRQSTRPQSAPEQPTTTRSRRNRRTAPAQSFNPENRSNAYEFWDVEVQPVQSQSTPPTQSEPNTERQSTPNRSRLRNRRTRPQRQSPPQAPNLVQPVNLPQELVLAQPAGIQPPIAERVEANEIDRIAVEARQGFDRSLEDFKAVIQQPHELRNKAGALAEKFKEGLVAVKGILVDKSDPRRIEKAAALTRVIDDSGKRANAELTTASQQITQTLQSQDLSLRDRQAYEKAKKYIDGQKGPIARKANDAERYFARNVAPAEVQAEFAGPRLPAIVAGGGTLAAIASVLFGGSAQAAVGGAAAGAASMLPLAAPVALGGLGIFAAYKAYKTRQANRQQAQVTPDPDLASAPEIAAPSLFDKIKTSIKSYFPAKEIDVASQSLDNLKFIAKRTIDAFGGFAQIAFVGYIFSKIGVESVLAAAKMQDLKLAVNSATGSQIAGRSLIAKSTAQANQLGYNYQNAIAADSSFSLATKGTAIELVAQDISQSLRQYGRVNGVDEERQKLGQLAVQQMAGKGQIMAEEVFGQLAESIPGAANVLARSQGLSLLQLRSRIQEGSLTPADALPRFGQQLNAESIGKVDEASQTASAQIGKVQNSILSLQAAAGEQFMLPATIGLNAFNEAIKFTQTQINSITNTFLGGVATLAVNGGILIAKLLLMQSGLGGIGAAARAALPFLKAFAVETLLYSAAFSSVQGIFMAFQNTSPLKSISDGLDVTLAKMKQLGTETQKTFGQIRTEKFAKNLNVFEQVGDFAIENILPYIVGYRKPEEVPTNAGNRADQDAITASEIIDKTQRISDTKPDLKIASSLKEREALGLELSILQARRAKLTSRDRDELESSLRREQAIIKKQADLNAPILKRQSDLESNIQSNREIANDSTQPEYLRAAATARIKEDEALQRQLQAELSRTSDRITDLTVGLRQLTFESSSALRSIEQNSQIQSTRNYTLATLDPRNVGGLQKVEADREIDRASSKRDTNQADLNKIQSKLSQNSGILAGLGVNPDTTSKEELDFLKATDKTPLSQQIIAYVEQYQQAKQELINSNDSLAKAQFNYLKSIADYNKQLTDKVISLDNKLVNLQISARNSIDSLQQAIEEQVIEIDRTSGKAMLQAQKNRMQTAYNKFLDKLGIGTDDIFEQIFQNYNSIMDTIGQISDRRLNTKKSGITAKYREKANESRKTQTEAQQSQSNSEQRRQNDEEKLTNPLNQLNPSNTETPPATSGEKSNLTSPVKGAISSGFGWRKHPVFGKRKFHNGVDYAVPVGTSIKAAGDGEVTFAGQKSGYGYSIDIKHPSGETTRYSHASKIGVVVGQKIRQGEEIGLSGGAKGHPGSGTSTGPHLDFEIRDSKGIAIDPLKRLKQNNNLGTPLSQKVLNENNSTTATQENLVTELADTKLKQGDIFNMAPFTTNPLRRTLPKPKEVFGPEYQPYIPVQKINQVPKIPSETFNPSHVMPNRGSAPSKSEPKYQPTQKNKTAPKIPPLPNQPPTTIKAVPKVSPLPTPDTIPYTNVISSFYTPGEGGKINGPKTDIRGKYIDRNSLVMATRTTASPQGIPYGATVELRNPQNGKTTIVKNVDRGTLRPGRDIDLTPAAANRLGVTPDGLASLQMRVIAVPKGQQLKSSYDLGGGVGSYDRKGNYTGKSGTIVNTAKEFAGNSVLAEEQKLNKSTDRKKDELIKANEEASRAYVAETKRLSDIDTSTTKKKLAQDRNLSNQEDQRDRLKIDTDLLKNRNFLDRKIPEFDRKTVQIQRDASAYNRSADRTRYQQLDKLNEQYGGTPDTTILDTSITEAQSTFDRIKEESRLRGENILKQIQAIQAMGAGWAETRKTLARDIKALRKNGRMVEADKLEQYRDDTDRAIGTPQALQRTINSLLNQYRNLSSDGINSYNVIAPGAAKVITDYQAINQEYQPKTFNDNLQAQGRSIVQRFKAMKDTIELEYKKFDLAAKELEDEIQVKLKAAGYAPQLIDVKDPERLKLLQKVAPEQTKSLVSAVENRDKLDTTSKQIDIDAQAAAARAVSIAQKREQINVDRANADYLVSTQGGDIATKFKVDQIKFDTGKAELDLQLDDKSISIDLYHAKLKQLTLETNTLRNALLPLREASNNFFQDIFKGKDILTGIGDAFRNLAISILTNLQNIITQKLGEQLFGTLQNIAGVKSDTNNGLNISLNNSPLDEDTSEYAAQPSRSYSSPRGIQIPNSYESYRKTQVSDDFIGPVYQPPAQPEAQNLGNQIGSVFLGGALKLLGIPGFAEGGMVTSPTFALVGEGIHNEAIVPLPNGRSIPVDLKGAGSSSGSNSNISNAISVTIQNNGQAKETSRGDANAIASLVQNLVTQGLINERRPGGLLAWPLYLSRLTW